MSQFPGVRIGPLDADRGESFGQIGGSTVARQLLRHHTAMHPQALTAALSRVRQDERSKGIDREEAEKVVRSRYKKLGEALPAESKIRGFAVRGNDEEPDLQVVTFTFSTVKNRTSKGFAPYEDFPKSQAAGDRLVELKRLKEEGIDPRSAPAPVAAPAPEVSFDQAAADQKIADLEKALEDAKTPSEDDPAAKRIAELEEQLAEATKPADTEVENTTAPTTEETPAGTPPPLPWDGYEGQNSKDVQKKLREDGSPELARAVIAYEENSGTGSRSGVIGVANEILNNAPPPVA